MGAAHVRCSTCSGTFWPTFWYTRERALGQPRHQASHNSLPRVDRRLPSQSFFSQYQGSFLSPISQSGTNKNFLPEIPGPPSHMHALYKYWKKRRKKILMNERAILFKMSKSSRAVRSVYLAFSPSPSWATLLLSSFFVQREKLPDSWWMALFS